MKNIFPLLFLLALVSSCSHKVFEKLDWQTTKTTHDGQVLVWSSPLRFYDEKSKINYTISNDRQNLYLCLNISDEAAKIKIIRGGMEFRIDTSGKRSFPIAFIFPLPNQIVLEKPSGVEMFSGIPHGEKPVHPKMNQKMLNHAKEARLMGFKPPLGETLSLSDNTSGISAAISFDSLGIMHYGAIIPFGTFYKNELTTDDADRIFSYEIKVTGLPVPSGYNENDGGMGMSGGGMRGGHHGGGSGGYNGGNGEGRPYSREPKVDGEYGHSNSDLYISNKIIKEMNFSVK